MRLIKLSSDGEFDNGSNIFDGTEEECREELSSRVCNMCYKDLIHPWMDEGQTPDGSTIVRETLNDLLWTACGAEYMVED